MDSERFRQAWAVVSSILTRDYSFGDIKVVVGLAGMDLAEMAHLVQSSKGATKEQLMSAIHRQVGRLDEGRLRQITLIVVEEMLRRKPDVQSILAESLERLGWTLHNGHLVEVAVFDISELPELPLEAHTDLLKAAVRLRDGDLSGAVTSASAAVDSVTSAIYRDKNLGNPGHAGFEQKVSESLKALDTAGEIERQLIALGWKPSDATTFAEDVRSSLVKGARALQTLRSRMGDVHGTKPILKPLVFDSVKWAALIVRNLT